MEDITKAFGEHKIELTHKLALDGDKIEVTIKAKENLMNLCRTFVVAGENTVTSWGSTRIVRHKIKNVLRNSGGWTSDLMSLFFTAEFVDTGEVKIFLDNLRDHQNFMYELRGFRDLVTSMLSLVRLDNTKTVLTIKEVD